MFIFVNLGVNFSEVLFLVEKMVMLGWVVMVFFMLIILWFVFLNFIILFIEWVEVIGKNLEIGRFFFLSIWYIIVFIRFVILIIVIFIIVIFFLYWWWCLFGIFYNKLVCKDKFL